MTVLPFPTRDATTKTRDQWQWQELARCNGTDPEAFFEDNSATRRTVIGICEKCPVRLLCLAQALRDEPPGERSFGIWGGTTAKARRLMPAEERAKVIAEAAAEAESLRRDLNEAA